VARPPAEEFRQPGLRLVWDQIGLHSAAFAACPDEPGIIQVHRHCGVASDVWWSFCVLVRWIDSVGFFECWLVDACLNFNGQ
jgi:hypothetical protein